MPSFFFDINFPLPFLPNIYCLCLLTGKLFSFLHEWVLLIQVFLLISNNCLLPIPYHFNRHLAGGGGGRGGRYQRWELARHSQKPNSVHVWYNHCRSPTPDTWDSVTLSWASVSALEKLKHRWPRLCRTTYKSKVRCQKRSSRVVLGVCGLEVKVVEDWDFITCQTLCK